MTEKYMICDFCKKKYKERDSNDFSKIVYKKYNFNYIYCGGEILPPLYFKRKMDICGECTAKDEFTINKIFGMKGGK